MQSLQPWQIQSLIATVAVVATIALTTTGWVMAMRTARHLQDREREHRQRSVARALSAEVRRIREELGSPPDQSLELSIYGSKPMVPNISHWVETVMVDAASVDPEIVENFMTLDRQLHNLRGDQQRLSQAYDMAEEARQGVTRIKGSMDEENPDDIEALADHLSTYSTTLAELKRKVRDAEQAVRLLEHLRNRMDESARLTLDRLQGILGESPPVPNENRFRRWRQRIPGLREKRHLGKS